MKTINLVKLVRLADEYTQAYAKMHGLRNKELLRAIFTTHLTMLLQEEQKHQQATSVL